MSTYHLYQTFRLFLIDLARNPFQIITNNLRKTHVIIYCTMIIANMNRLRDLNKQHSAKRKKVED